MGGDVTECRHGTLRRKCETCDAWEERDALRARVEALEQGDVPDAQRREVLGRLVRAVWVEWAREQPNPKPSWLAPWEALGEPDREVDRRIGETLERVGYGRAYQARAALAQSAPAPVTLEWHEVRTLPGERGQIVLRGAADDVHRVLNAREPVAIRIVAPPDDEAPVRDNAEKRALDFIAAKSEAERIAVLTRGLPDAPHAQVPAEAGPRPDVDCLGCGGSQAAPNGPCDCPCHDFPHAQVPADVAARHDAEVRAAALEEAARAVEAIERGHRAEADRFMGGSGPRMQWLAKAAVAVSCVNAIRALSAQPPGDAVADAVKAEPNRFRCNECKQAPVVVNEDACCASCGAGAEPYFDLAVRETEVRKAERERCIAIVREVRRDHVLAWRLG